MLEEALNLLDTNGFELVPMSESGVVEVGDYLIYRPNHAVLVKRVVAVRYEQGSGPTPSRFWAAFEGDSQIVDLKTKRYVIVRPKP